MFATETTQNGQYILYSLRNTRGSTLYKKPAGRGKGRRDIYTHEALHAPKHLSREKKKQQETHSYLHTHKKYRGIPLKKHNIG